MSRSGFIAFVKHAFANTDSVEDYDAFMQALPLELDRVLGAEMNEEARLRSELEQQIAANDATFSQMQTEAREFKAELEAQSELMRTELEQHENDTTEAQTALHEMSEADSQLRSELEQLRVTISHNEAEIVEKDVSLMQTRSELLAAQQGSRTSGSSHSPQHTQNDTVDAEQAVPRLPLEEPGRLSNYFLRTPPGSARSSGSSGAAAVLENAMDPTRAMQVAAQRLRRGQTERPTANTDAVVQLAMEQARLRREAAERRAVDAQIQEERVVRAIGARQERDEDKKVRAAAREQKRKDSDDKRRREDEFKKQKLELALEDLQNKLKK